MKKQQEAEERRRREEEEELRRAERQRQRQRRLEREARAAAAAGAPGSSALASSSSSSSSAAALATAISSEEALLMASSSGPSGMSTMMKTFGGESRSASGAGGGARGRSSGSGLSAAFGIGSLGSSNATNSTPDSAAYGSYGVAASAAAAAGIEAMCARGGGDSGSVGGAVVGGFEHLASAQQEQGVAPALAAVNENSIGAGSQAATEKGRPATKGSLLSREMRKGGEEQARRREAEASAAAAAERQRQQQRQHQQHQHQHQQLQQQVSGTYVTRGDKDNRDEVVPGSTPLTSLAAPTAPGPVMTPADHFSLVLYTQPQYRYRCCLSAQHGLGMPSLLTGFSAEKVEREFVVPTERDVYSMLRRLFTQCQLGAECAIVALIYVERLMEVAGVEVSWIS